VDHNRCPTIYQPRNGGTSEPPGRSFLSRALTAVGVHASAKVHSLRFVGDEGSEDTTAIRRLVLDGLAGGDSVEAIAEALRPLHRDGSTHPAAVLLELAADAYLACGSSRSERLALEGLAERWLPEDPARGNVGHSKRRHCVQGAVLIAAGAEPEDTGWWSFDDLWRHSLDAVVVFVRAAADRRNTTVETVCTSLRAD